MDAPSVERSSVENFERTFFVDARLEVRDPDRFRNPPEADNTFSRERTFAVLLDHLVGT
jgi:hypothetical protein